MKNILILLTHPNPNSFCAGLAERYQAAAKAAGHTVTLINTYDLKFDPHLDPDNTPTSEKDFEPDLQKVRSLISAANHVVVIYPTWWGGPPAIFKALIDRVFTSGYAFIYEKHQKLPKRLLTRKSARIITTMDAPAFIYKLVFRAGQQKMLKNHLFTFVGFRPTRFTVIGNVRKSSDKDRQTWLKKVAELGTKAR